MKILTIIFTLITTILNTKNIHYHYHFNNKSHKTSQNHHLTVKLQGDGGESGYYLSHQFRENTMRKSTGDDVNWGLYYLNGVYFLKGTGMESNLYLSHSGNVVKMRKEGSGDDEKWYRIPVGYNGWKWKAKGKELYLSHANGYVSLREYSGAGELWKD